MRTTCLSPLPHAWGVTVEKLVSDDFVKERLSQSPDMEQVRGLKEELENAQSTYSEAPETVRKAIRFREEFPFLRQPDCPDELKVLVADMFSAYDLSIGKATAC